jgi:hypothetical protein
LEIIFLLTGLIVGALAAWIIAKSKFSRPEGIPLENLESGYVQKSLYVQLIQENK